MYARRFQVNLKTREALITELEILASMKGSEIDPECSGNLARLIEKRLAAYVGREHTRVVST